MANEIKVADTKAQQVSVKTNNSLTEFMTSSDSWQMFMNQLPAKTQSEIKFDVYAYVNKNAETVAKMQPNDFMARVVDCYSKGFTLKDGDAYIIPFNQTYKDKEGNEHKIVVATFVEGYKGVVRLALESGLFKYFDCVPVIKESIISFDYRRNVPIFNNTYIANGTEQVIGYLAFSETHNGTIREIYHPVEHFKKFALKNSIQCRVAKKLAGVWLNDFDSMCKKTALKELGKVSPRVTNPNAQQSQFFNYIDNEENDLLMPPETYENTAVMGEDLNNAPFEEQIVDSTKKSVKTPNTSELKCSECSTVITAAVYDYSVEKYGKALCYACQKKHKKG